MGGVLHLVQRGGEWAGPVYQSPYCPLLSVVNVNNCQYCRVHVTCLQKETLDRLLKKQGSKTKCPAKVDDD